MGEKVEKALYFGSLTRFSPESPIPYRYKSSICYQGSNLRTRIKRLVRRTICFSKTERMHDLVIGLFINRYEFGVSV
jgi:hypothetical protein